MVHYLYMVHIFLKRNILSSIVHLSNFKIPHHSQYFVMDASSLIEDLISCAEESMKKIESLLSMAEILPRSNIMEFKDGTNFPYKFSTIFRKVRRELNKTIVQTLKEEIEGWTTEISRVKKLKNEHMKKREMKNEREPSNKKINGNLE